VRTRSFRAGIALAAVDFLVAFGALPVASEASAENVETRRPLPGLRVPRVGINSRLRWIIVPGREFFLVLNQDLLTEGGVVTRGRTEPVIKLGWTFRY
jgi:hypothetical protein